MRWHAHPCPPTPARAPAHPQLGAQAPAHRLRLVSVHHAGQGVHRLAVDQQVEALQVGLPAQKWRWAGGEAGGAGGRSWWGCVKLCIKSTAEAQRHAPRTAHPSALVHLAVALPTQNRLPHPLSPALPQHTAPQRLPPAPLQPHTLRKSSFPLWQETPALHITSTSPLPHITYLYSSSS